METSEKQSVLLRSCQTHCLPKDRGSHVILLLVVNAVAESFTKTVHTPSDIS